MLDLANRSIDLNDQVLYIGLTRKGEPIRKQGKVIGFTKNGVKVQTQQGVIKVKNVVKINDTVQNKQVGLLGMLKRIFK